MKPVFVFGSNKSGRHGKGSALFAKKYRGAVYGQGEGRQGNSYAIPTKDENLKSLSITDIEVGINHFFAHASLHRDDVFELTPVGCGLAGYSKRDIWEILKRSGIPSNVLLSRTWVTDVEK